MSKEVEVLRAELVETLTARAKGLREEADELEASIREIEEEAQAARWKKAHAIMRKAFLDTARRLLKVPESSLGFHMERFGPGMNATVAFEADSVACVPGNEDAESPASRLILLVRGALAEINPRYRDIGQVSVACTEGGFLRRIGWQTDDEDVEGFHYEQDKLGSSAKAGAVLWWAQRFVQTADDPLFQGERGEHGDAAKRLREAILEI